MLGVCLSDSSTWLEVHVLVVPRRTPCAIRDLIFGDVIRDIAAKQQLMESKRVSRRIAHRGRLRWIWFNGTTPRTSCIVVTTVTTHSDVYLEASDPGFSRFSRARPHSLCARSNVERMCRRRIVITIHRPSSHCRDCCARCSLTVANSPSPSPARPSGGYRPPD